MKKEISAIHKENLAQQKRKRSNAGWTKKKTVAACIISAGVLALVAFIVMIFVFDLGPVREIKSSEEDARVVGKIAGYEVRYEELRYVTLLYRAELDREIGEYETLSDEKKAEYEQRLQDKVLEEIKSNYVILFLCDKYGVNVDSKDAKSYVKDSIENLVNEIGGKKEYKAWLAENNITDALLRLIYKTEYLESALLAKLIELKDEIKFSDKDNSLDDFVDFVVEDDSYVKVIHAYYPRENKYIDGWNVQMAKQRAEAALKRINAAENDEDRLTIMNREIGKAPFVPGYSVQGNTDYYITHGQMHPDYEKVAFSLDMFSVGEIVELDEGYYIIMRVPKSRDEVAPNAYRLIDDYSYAVLKGIEEECADKISFEGNEYFNGLKLVEVK